MQPTKQIGRWDVVLKKKGHTQEILVRVLDHHFLGQVTINNVIITYGWFCKSFSVFEIFEKLRKFLEILRLFLKKKKSYQYL